MIMHEQIISLFISPEETLYNGLWMSGKREGEYKKWYRNGQQRESCFYKDEEKMVHLNNGILTVNCIFFVIIDIMN